MLAVLAAIVGPATMLPLVGLLTPIQVFEIEVWYLSFFLICAPFAAAAATLALRALGRRVPAAAAAVLLALLPAYPFATNLSKADLRGFRFPEEHGRNRARTFAYRAIVAYPFYGRQGMFVDSYVHFVEGMRPDVALVEPRNTIRSELEAVRRAPRFIVDPDAAEAWWFEFKRELFAGSGDRPFYFNVNEGDARAWGAELIPYGLVYRARRPGSKEVFPAPPWKRYEYRGLRGISSRLGEKELPYCPTTYRVWAAYFTMAAEYCFRLGRGGAAFRNLAEAARGGPKDMGVALLTAATYNANGYPGKAIPLYLEYLPQVERSRYDSLLFRRDYSITLNELAVAYLNVGEAETARRYFEESLAVTPEQPGLRRYLYGAEAPPGGSGGEDARP
jgi:tetratricopeptide (TPR) repeat protein